MAIVVLGVGLVGHPWQASAWAAASSSSPSLPPASGGPAVQTSPPPLGVAAGSPSPPGPTPPPASPASGPSSASPEGDGAAGQVPSPGERTSAPRDGLSYESDHDAVLPGWGIAVTPLSTQLPVFALRASTGCPLSASPAPASDCPQVNVSAIDVRRWMTRAWAVNVGLAFALGGGRDHGRLLDTYVAAGPRLGVSVVLGNWKHMVVMASPDVSVVIFRPAGSADTTHVIDVDANLEAEVHFGFWGLPALSLSLRSGLRLRIEHAPDVTRWSVGPTGVTTLTRLVNDVSLRYYF